ncbi:phosphotransferase family protein [Paenibacillus guangzhouensis]|uniref:phosphotransferase family protein n=1 Tax=Paenibacillus guangzhouensis TaxID=1473112 RepID=UPI00187BA45C|nr:phosphotransferase [Paenibacillus guangzhouensis]
MNLRQWIRRLNPTWKLLRSWKLKGGISAQVIGLEIAQADEQNLKLVARVHGDADIEHNPSVASDEFNLLQVLRSQGVLVPKPYVVDHSRSLFDRPALLIEYIEGQTEFAPTDMNDYIKQMASAISKLHHIDCTKVDVSFLPRQIDHDRKLRNIAILKKIHIEGDAVIHEKILAFLHTPSKNRAAILHGDFWPGNLMWKDGQLVAMIDWEDAAFGDPLSDLANGRLEMLFYYGVEAMEQFTNQYVALMPRLDLSHLAFWDIYAAVRLAGFAEWGLDVQIVDRMRERHNGFVQQAVSLIKRT